MTANADMTPAVGEGRHLPQYLVTVERRADVWPWRYWWSTSNGPWRYTGMTFTLSGAKRASRRAVIRFKRDAERFEQRHIWIEEA